MPQIHQWENIADSFRDALLLGNGASIAVDPCFTYRSLLATAEEEGLITASVQRVFDYLKTNDFELVMSMIWHSYHVNRALGIVESTTKEAYDDVRAALVRSVQTRHSGYDISRPHLRSMYEFMRRFTDVLTLNYDLLVYWAMLEGNREHGNWFKDGFIGGTFDLEWERLYQPFRAEGATLVFYPHGNLALISDLTGADRKLVKDHISHNLLSRIVSKWNSGDGFPLFVSEGDSSQKERAILRSGYLSTVYNGVLPHLGPSCVCYGWSLSDNDDHILRRLCRGKVSRLAISLFKGERNDRELQDEAAALELKVRKMSTDVKVMFFDAGSAGCWVNP